MDSSALSSFTQFAGVISSTTHSALSAVVGAHEMNSTLSSPQTESAQSASTRAAGVDDLFHSLLRLSPTHSTSSTLSDLPKAASLPSVKSPSTQNILSAAGAAALPSHLRFLSTSPAPAFSLNEQALQQAAQALKNSNLASKGYYVEMVLKTGQAEARVCYLTEGEIGSEQMPYDQIDAFVRTTVPTKRGSLNRCPESLGDYLIKKWLEGTKSKIADTYSSAPPHLYVGGYVPYREFRTDSPLFPTIYMMHAWEKNCEKSCEKNWEKNQLPKTLYFATEQARTNYIDQKKLSNATTHSRHMEGYIALAAPAIYKKRSPAKNLLFFFKQPDDLNACLLIHDGKKVTTKIYGTIEATQHRIEQEKANCHFISSETLVNEDLSQDEIDILDTTTEVTPIDWTEFEASFCYAHLPTNNFNVVS